MRFGETIGGAAEGVSGRRRPQLVRELQRSSWLDRRAASRSHLPQPHDAHAMSKRLQSCNSYPEEKRSACLSGSTRPFFAQRFTRPLDRIRRKSRSTFARNGHQQSPLPFELDLQGRRSNGDGTLFPTNLKRHSWLYPGFATNVFWNYQSSGVIYGCFHGI